MYGRWIMGRLRILRPRMGGHLQSPNCVGRTDALGANADPQRTGAVEMTDRPIIFTDADIARFFALVSPEPNSGCWLWEGTITKKGYGRFWNGVSSEPAHRSSLRIAGVTIPDGHETDHLCRVRWCVNPTHLEPVTHKVNLQRGNTLSSIASAKTHCPAGHTLSGINLAMRSGKRMCRECDRLRQCAAYQPTSTRRRRRHLTLAERDTIASLIKAGVSHSKISAQLGVSMATVSYVRNGKNKYDGPANNI